MNFTSAINNQRSKPFALLFVTRLMLQPESCLYPNPESGQACNRRNLSGKTHPPPHSPKGLTSVVNQPRALAGQRSKVLMPVLLNSICKGGEGIRALVLQKHCSGKSWLFYNSFAKF